MRSIPILGLLSLLGCAPDTGIWLLEIDASGASECETTLAHNFVDVVAPTTGADEDPNWTEEDNSTQSPELVFVQVESGGGDLCSMLWGTKVLPGTCVGSSWNFKWDAEDMGDSSSVHALGYTYSESYEYRAKTNLSLNVSSESGTGTLKSSSTTNDSYIESDMWAQAVGVTTGRLPAGRYLKTQTTNAEGAPTISATANTRPDSECAASECTLDATSTCSTPERTVRAYYYAFGDDPNYNNVKNNSQSAGFPTVPNNNGQQGDGPDSGE
jgi:hypothetical protein